MIKNNIEPKFLYNKEEIKSGSYLLNSMFALPSSQKIFGQNLNFSKKFKILYAIFYKQFRYIRTIDEKKLNAPLNMDMRHNLDKLSKEEDNFVKFVCNLIKYNLPKAYLENYDAIKNSIKEFKVPSNPKIIMTSTDQSYNDAFKFYTAQKVIGGSKLFIFQHGGHYGTCALPHTF